MSRATVALPRQAPRPRPRSAAAASARGVRLYVRGIGTVALPWWPEEISYAGPASTYDEQERPGRKPLLLRTGLGLEEMRIGCIVSGADLELGAQSVTGILDALRAMAQSPLPVAVKLASRQGSYRIADLGITELDWGTDGAPLSAEVSMTLKEASDAVVPVGPIKRGGRG